MNPNTIVGLSVLLAMLVTTLPTHAQTLDAELQRASVQELVAGARQLGDATRGAIVFHQPSMACAKCHVVGSDQNSALGPNLATLGQDVSDEAIIESVLLPSKSIRQGFESISVLTVEGKLISAFLVEQTPERLILRDVARDGELVTIAADEIEEIKTNELSIMPAGQMNQLGSRQQFFDLVRYLIEIRDGGPTRAMQLQPSPSLLVLTIPEYENRLDHAGLIAKWNAETFQRGEAIYQRVCANCHGTHDTAGSLPTSLRFAEGKFKNGSDALSMYRTLTHGFGQMAPQSWMVPSQKYDVIHYIREAYLKTHNPSQLTKVDSAYLSALPTGDTTGPEPSNIEAWSAMDYGPSLIHTYEIPGSQHNFAYKGIAMRLDPGAGGVARGGHWMVFDTDTLRVAAGWNSGGSTNNKNNFIDWRAIQFNGEHGVHPRVVGQVAFANGTGPGWGRPTDGSFADDQRVTGRDGRQYGPLPATWGQFRGLYHHDQQVILSYTIGDTPILEMPRLLTPGNAPPVLLRTFNIGPRQQELVLQVAQHSAQAAQLKWIEPSDPSAISVDVQETTTSEDQRPLQLDGETYLEIPNVSRMNVNSKDFSIVARIKTDADGTIFSMSDGGELWIPNGQSLFLRDGRLVFDIGWVGAVSGKTKVSDNRWHLVALTWEQATQRVRLYVDGRLDGEGKLAAKAPIANAVARIGFTSKNFPEPESFFHGEIESINFYQRAVHAELAKSAAAVAAPNNPLASWSLTDQLGSRLPDSTEQGLEAVVRRGMATVRPSTGPLHAGFAPRDLRAEWFVADGNLRLRIPAGDQPLKFSVWLPSASESNNAEASTPLKTIVAPPILDAAMDLEPLTRGGPNRWAQSITTKVERGSQSDPFGVDILQAPESNPWLALTRFTGLDFYPDGRIAVCTWDGDVWIATPRAEGEQDFLDWRRIASGLFQPLGLKIVNNKIHLICRDQLTVLHDLNADGEIDFYECLNNDHQVTEHFHEFAMGLQTDSEGNFYYAKSGCHGKAAVVPHHGTLLKITADGSRTEILANGFRAANGVCLNPDGSFVVTDQEGFWNPKNRINWVTLSETGRPNFYGNMLGYQDVTDESDSAMIQPLCWITNEFDRSPAELLWVDSPRWGPLHGSLLNLSYGYGKVYLVPHEQLHGQMQGGMIELPLPSFPTGVMRGRFQPTDGQLYLCGMFAWAGSATHPGGLYRIRYNEQPTGLPLELHAFTWGMELKFADELDPDSIENLQNFAIQAWDLKRTARYGSDHINQRPWSVTSARLMPDKKTLRLQIPDIAPTWGMEILYQVKSATGREIRGKIHNTIHHLKDSDE
ncbi:MAG: LamG-like jellyroll fold domain-containing protein [Pirellulaceae bacterium]|nr:LamG-like jellyroll fold domain-containing protein [Pirellulaceae bacterium]